MVNIASSLTGKYMPVLSAICVSCKLLSTALFMVADRSCMQ